MFCVKITRLKHSIRRKWLIITLQWKWKFSVFVTRTQQTCQLCHYLLTQWLAVCISTTASSLVFRHRAVDFESTLDNILSGSAVDTGSVASNCSNTWTFGYTGRGQKFSAPKKFLMHGPLPLLLGSTDIHVMWIPICVFSHCCFLHVTSLESDLKTGIYVTKFSVLLLGNK